MECGVFRKLGEVNNFWPLKFHSQDALVLSFDYTYSQLLGIFFFKDPIQNSVEMDLFVSDSWNPRPTELTEPQGQKGSQKGRFFNYQCYTANFSYVPLHYLLVCREITSQYPRPASVLPCLRSACWLSRWRNGDQFRRSWARALLWSEFFSVFVWASFPHQG